MTQLTPQDVLADLLGEPPFELQDQDTDHAAKLVIERLRDAGFEIVPARGREETRKILTDHFWTGEPGQHDAIEAATNALYRRFS